MEKNKKMSLAELKMKASANIVVNVEAIKGGNLDGCHAELKPGQLGPIIPTSTPQGCH